MHKILVFLAISGFCLVMVGDALAQINVRRFQLVSGSAGQQAGVFLIDTASGCTWQLASTPET